jgi:trans-aconitate methyltransferase
MDFIEFENEKYFKFQAEGNMTQYAYPYVKHFCKGIGYDIGCNKLEWALPNSIPIDLNFNNEFNATNLPKNNVDYIYSSHCLEHIERWVDVLDYWTSKIKSNGILFLYLPHYEQKYWRPWNNRKHLHVFTEEILRDYLDKDYKNINISGKDFNYSFMVVSQKKEII